MKYLGLYLKPKQYKKCDWQWLRVKVEKRINTRCNRWLSKGGHLVLVKANLEAIPVYWISLALVPKGVLETIRKLCYKFIWFGYQKKKGLLLDSCEKMALPKSFGRWGHENPFFFSKALAAKKLWRLIQERILWVQVVRAKYIAPNIMEDWIKNSIKQ
jgi:hypothetical protein